jgi:predicted LPLAT superfamily acyltransferase
MSSAVWTRRRERGSSLLIRFMIWLTRTGGWPIARVLLYPISAYFFLRPGSARAASRDYLRRVLSRPATWGDQFRHIFVFSCVLLERVLLWSGQIGRFHLNVIGLDHLTEALKAERGCIMLGSHLGSFDVLRAFGRDSPVPVRPLMYRFNSGPFTHLLEQLDPHVPTQIIEIGAPDSMLQVRDALTRGEIVGVLADRAPSLTVPDRKSIRAPFLGDWAPFPTGPFTLVRHLGVPSLLFFALRTGPCRYELRFEPFTPTNDLSETIALFAARLEQQCRAHPFNWFNFYLFWELAPPASNPARIGLPAAVQPPGGGPGPAAQSFATGPAPD